MTDNHHDTLKSLYPHLSGKNANLPDRGELLDAIQRKNDDSIAIRQRFFTEHSETLIDTAAALANVFLQNGKLLCMGNGGSSCDAAHLTVEFSHPVSTGRPALPAINLSADIAMLTAVGNDVGYEQVFQRQVIALGQKGDALFGLSTSGNSENLMSAFKAARERGMLCIALLGGDGGRIAGHSEIDHCLIVATNNIHRIQETHVACYHILWDLVHTLMAARR